ncbi:TonB-dependent receptor [Sediminicola luteus]|uniref:TonB-dependent receptor n=1 Tax=Sediminicola luteus TaxID=319238 RepID=A0A2A4G7T6_9FLAO|nr:carboxypeptidase-like regulatory domain-containing protein [Sediminicola luteus]PCE64491.1 TonB-dependent receptor [Sediminicola luteus]
MPKATPKARILLGCLLLLLGIQSFGQATDNVTLRALLEQLESRHDIRFSYANQDVDQIFLPPISENSPLTGALNHINLYTGLKVQKINSRYYSLVLPTALNICGFVLDNFGKNTVSGATIEVLGTETKLITDAQGKFELQNVARGTQLLIRFLGFKRQVVTAEELDAQKGCQRIMLAKKYHKLDEVILYEFLTTGLRKKTDGSIEMDTEEFGLLPGLIEPDILQTAQALPGIRSIDESVSNLNVRGGTNDQNLILWEGIKMYQSGHFFGLISAFNPYLTDHVVLTKNGTSARYGDGVSSLISLKTRNHLVDRFTGGAGINLINGDVFGQVPLRQNMDLQFSARRSFNDFVNSPTYNSFVEKTFQDTDVRIAGLPREIERRSNEDFHFYDFSLKYLWDLNDSHKFRLSFINMQNELSYEETDASDVLTNESSLKQGNISVGGQWSSTWFNGLQTRLEGYYTRYEMLSNSDKVQDNQLLAQKNTVEEAALTFSTEYAFTEQLRWVNGYQFVESGVGNFTNVSLPPFKSDIKEVVRSHSVFSEMAYSSPNEKLHARLGARLNYIQSPDNLVSANGFDTFIPEPRLNLSYKLNDYWAVQLLGEFKSQTTNQVIDLKQNFLGIEKRRWVLSDNDSLPISKSRQLSSGISYDSKSLYMGLTGFWKKVKGISTNTQGFQNPGQFNGEVGEYTVKGAEFLINKKGARYSTWLSYTFNQNDYYFEDLDPSTFPNNQDIRHSVNLAATYNLNGWQIGAGLNYHSGRPYTQPDSDDPINSTIFPSQINYNSPNSSRLDDYIRADASVVYKLNLSARVKASAGASVLNLFNKTNILNTYYRLNQDNQTVETIRQGSLGFTPNFSFRVYF